MAEKLARGQDNIPAVGKAAGIGARNAERLRVTEVNKLGAYTEFTVDDAQRYHAATYSIGMGVADRVSREFEQPFGQ